MKTLLLLLAGLALSAQAVDKFSPAVPSNYFTGRTLNGAWWEHATQMERWVYLQGVSETLPFATGFSTTNHPLFSTVVLSNAGMLFATRRTQRT